MKLFSLCKQDVSLAAAEIDSLASGDSEISNSFLIKKTGFSDYQRLAYTKNVYRLLFTAYKDDLEKKFSRFSWKRIYSKSFCLRVFESSNTKLSSTRLEKKLASVIWNSLEGPVVDLDSAETEIHVLKSGSRFFCGKLLFRNKEDFDSRKPHLRPSLHPTGMHPRLARAMINLSGIKKGRLLDPFCGSGGILIEAGLLGLDPVGYDIDENVLEKARLNLASIDLKAELEKKDASALSGRFPYVVSELPFGLNTRSTDLRKLYLDFLKNLKKVLGKKAVITFPDFINYKFLISQSGLRISKEFSYYIHRSLTKKIIIIEI